MKPRTPPRSQPRNQRLSSTRQRKQQHLLDVKVRSRAANRQRNRRLLTLISALLLICGAAGGSWYGARILLRKYLWQNPEYNLSEIDIHTDGSLSREQVLGATQIHEGVNIYTIHLSAARKALMALPQVERAEIERVQTNKISINISERKPVAWVTDKDDTDPTADPAAFLVDKDGILLRVKSQVPEYFHLPVICGVEVDNYDEGQTIDLPEVKAALELIRITGLNPARYQVRSIDVSRGYCMIVTDERHAKITFGLDDIGSQLDWLEHLYATVDISRQEIQTVNLMVKRNTPVTFVPPPDPNAPDPTDPDAVASPSPAAATASPSPAAKSLLSTKKINVRRAQAVHKSSASSHHSITVRRAIPISTPGSQP